LPRITLLLSEVIMAYKICSSSAGTVAKARAPAMSTGTLWVSRRSMESISFDRFLLAWTWSDQYMLRRRHLCLLGRDNCESPCFNRFPPDPHHQIAICCWGEPCHMFYRWSHRAKRLNFMHAWDLNVAQVPAHRASFPAAWTHWCATRTTMRTCAHMDWGDVIPIWRRQRGVRQKRCRIAEDVVKVIVLFVVLSTYCTVEMSYLRRRIVSMTRRRIVSMTRPGLGLGFSLGRVSGRRGNPEVNTWCTDR
jgi:hypothetical protein